MLLLKQNVKAYKMEESENITLRFPSGGIIGVTLLPLKWVSHRHLLLLTSPGLGWRLGARPAALSLAPQTRNEPPEPQAWFSLSSACGSHLPWPVVERAARSDSWQHKSHAGLTKSMHLFGAIGKFTGSFSYFLAKADWQADTLLLVARKQAGGKDSC